MHSGHNSSAVRVQSGDPVYIHRDIEFVLTAAVENAFDGRHIGIITAPADSNVLFGAGLVVSRIEVKPALTRQIY